MKMYSFHYISFENSKLFSSISQKLHLYRSNDPMIINAIFIEIFVKAILTELKFHRIYLTIIIRYLREATQYYYAILTILWRCSQHIRMVLKKN